MPDVTFTVTPEAREMMRQGYMCCNCLEPFDEPFPEHCHMPGCNFPVREEQTRYLSWRMYDDPSVVAPGLPVDRERAHLEEFAHQARPAMKVPKGAPKRRSVRRSV